MTGFPDTAPARPLWLVTLADLALLLVGFVLLLQALARQDPATVAAGIRQGFAGSVAEPAAMPVAAAGLDGFIAGSATLPGPAAPVAAWAVDAVRDPRVVITVTGEADGRNAADRDPASGSAAILAGDRARALAVALVQAGVPPARLAVAAQVGRRAAATATLAFAGDATKAN